MVHGKVWCGEYVNDSDKGNQIKLLSLFESTQEKMVAEFSSIRQAVDHGVTLGDETEILWRDFIEELLPSRYQVCDGFVVDADGRRSDQIDVIVFDRHYSPPLFQAGNVQYVPAESVYAVFEVKQRIDKWTLRQASAKASSVRCLRRTTARIPTADGLLEPKPPHWIVGGILALGYGKPNFAESTIARAMSGVSEIGRLDLGCAIRDGSFAVTYEKDCGARVYLSQGSSSLVTFFFQLLSMLQRIGTVSAIDYTEYLKAVTETEPPLRRSGPTQSTCEED